jgi:hypothetical protein
MLNIADPIIVHAHNHFFPQFNNAINDVKNSGALVHTAIIVAPAISSDNFRFLAITSKLFTK